MNELIWLATKAILWLASKIDIKSFKEDVRKAGLVIFGTGFIGIVVGADNLSIAESVVLLIAGTVFWIIGLIKGDNDET